MLYTVIHTSRVGFIQKAGEVFNSSDLTTVPHHATLGWHHYAFKDIHASKESYKVVYKPHELSGYIMIHLPETIVSLVIINCASFEGPKGLHGLGLALAAGWN